MFSPQVNVSPFDVNMACDAGYDAIIPYTNVTLPDIKSLVQDAIFSRSLSNAKKQEFSYWKGRFFGFRYDGFCKTINGSSV